MTNPHLKPRTIREWLDLIPFDRARKEAIENYDQKYVDSHVSGDICYSLSMAIKKAFKWYESPQNATYWFTLIATIISMEDSIKLKQDPPTMGMSY